MTENAPSEFEKLTDTVEKLRGPEGCPWDKEQTHESLRRYAIEETYELVEAIESGEPAKLMDELGDVLLQVMLHAQIAREAGRFDISDICRNLREKLQRRHPHVFEGLEVSGIDEIWENWEQIKLAEAANGDRESALDGVPKSLPALMRAAKLSRKAAKTGFDWPDIHAVIDKLKEETRELEVAIDRDDDREIGEEIGDLLFTVVNVARFRGIDPEESLRDMLSRFISRFGVIEARARDSGQSIGDMTLEEMDRVWEEAKRGNSIIDE